MSAIIPTDRVEECSICFEGFSPPEVSLRGVRVKHEGKDHDGFHKSCLLGWLERIPTCPIDREPINPKSLMSRTERIMERIKPALVNAAYAATCCGVAIGAALNIGGGALSAGLVGGGILATATAAAEVVGAARAVGVEATTGIGIAGTAFLGALLEAQATPTLRATMVALVGTMVGVKITAAGINSIFNHRGVDNRARISIGIGMYLAGLTTIAASTYLTTPSLFPIIAASVGAVTTGTFSLIRR